MPSLDNLTIICDEEDRARICSRNWTIDSDGRIRATIKGRTVRLHQFVLSGIKFIDHKNGNQLDVRKDNLRSADTITNAYNRGKTKANKSGYKGVFIDVRLKKKKFLAYITVNQKRMHIGYFESAEEAAMAYDTYAEIYHGQFANLNFPS